MRHFLFALLIALLPLRGWISDAMATQMAAGQLQHQTTQAAGQAGHVHEAVNAAMPATRKPPRPCTTARITPVTAAVTQAPASAKPAPPARHVMWWRYRLLPLN
jgi:hypothetical protein